jgi:hypothetical protein
MKEYARIVLVLVLVLVLEVMLTQRPPINLYAASYRKVVLDSTRFSSTSTSTSTIVRSRAQYSITPTFRPVFAPFS